MATILDSGGTVTETICITGPRVPAETTSAGNMGEFAWDDNFFYVCIRPNYWVRVVTSRFDDTDVSNFGVTIPEEEV